MAITVPRWTTPILGLFAWLVAIPLAHCGIPWALSMLAPRYGWAEGRPGTFNLVGLIPLAAGAMCLFWVLVVGLAQIHKLPERVELNWSPTLLMMNGPYAFSRNPMYVAEAMLWFGCAIFFGSIPVLIGLVIFCIAVNVIVRHEEPALDCRRPGPHQHAVGKKLRRLFRDRCRFFRSQQRVASLACAPPPAGLRWRIG
jgi:protein-S-isoprenylcysteine O-methyltransferase Ste14